MGHAGTQKNSIELLRYYAGLFVARISRGRTVGELIGYSLVAPFLYCLFWFALAALFFVMPKLLPALSDDTQTVPALTQLLATSGVPAIAVLLVGVQAVILMIASRVTGMAGIRTPFAAVCCLFWLFAVVASVLGIFLPYLRLSGG